MTKSAIAQLTEAMLDPDILMEAKLFAEGMFSMDLGDREEARERFTKHFTPDQIEKIKVFAKVAYASGAGRTMRKFVQEAGLTEEEPS